jgi:hypothetical protein
MTPGKRSRGSRKGRRHKAYVPGPGEHAVRAREAATRLAVRWAEIVESPPVDPRMRGEQQHALDRLERLGESAREEALRLYYRHGLVRFAARVALGLSHEEALLAHGAPELEASRVAIDLERSASPGCAVVNGGGQLITCLSGDMPTSGLVRLSFDEFRALRDYHEAWRRSNGEAVQLARETDLFQVRTRIADAGWLTAREDVEILIRLGLAGEYLVEHSYKTSVLRYAEDWDLALRSTGVGSDLYVRNWFRSSGELAALHVVMTAAGYRPSAEHAARLLALDDPLLAMAIGACRWHGSGGAADEALEAIPVPETEVPVGRRTALTTYYGLVLRSAQGRADPDGTGDLARVRLEEELAWFRRTTSSYPEPPPAVLTWGCELAATALGRTEDTEIAGDPDDDPPVRLEDLCLRGGNLSFVALRRLARRILRPRRFRPPALFLPRARLADWRRRLGPLDRVRPGTYRLPLLWASGPDPARPAPTPARNEPCPCGSGLKYKKCCMATAKTPPAGSPDDPPGRSGDAR